MAMYSSSGISLFELSIDKVATAFENFATDDYVKITRPESLTTVKTGANGNSSFNINRAGGNADIELRSMIAGDLDEYLKNYALAYSKDPDQVPSLAMKIFSTVANKLNGVTGSLVVSAQGIIIDKLPDISFNQNGSSDVNYRIWKLKAALLVEYPIA